MIIYKNDACGFLEDVSLNRITDKIEESFVNLMGFFPKQERTAYTNSMLFMETIVRKSAVEEDCGILVEYKIPLTSKRIDFLITGRDERDNRNFVIVELKQWQTAEKTDQDGVIVTFLGGGKRETTHPCYQANSYKCLLLDYNENLETHNITPQSCAYLHNYKEKQPEPLTSALYQEIILDTPIFFKEDSVKLQEFIRKHVGRGKGMEILYDIHNGKIRPSKKLIDHICELFKGNKAFILIDNQKVAYEKALAISRSVDEKNVLIVKGGPGTGKSIISVNLLGGLLQEEQNVVFVAPNAAFRDVMIAKLARDHRKNRLNNLFKGSGQFLECDENSFDTIIVDEAHRLKNGSAYQYYGENQLEDIINAARNTILFIDDDQRIRPDDIGTVTEIKRVARKFRARVQEIELEAQFRCSGAEGYVNWLDHILQIRETANYDGWDQGEFEFKIYKNPNKLREAIRLKNISGYDARILAGYAWPWTSEKDGNPDGEIDDVVIPEHGFRMPWNSRKARTTWAIDKSGVEQIGCIHTSQGLEFDYVGIIVGNDLQFDLNNLSYRVDWHAYKDSSGKKNLKSNPEKLCELVRNIYKTLMSRGMKGCYVYFENRNLEKHFEDNLAHVRNAVVEPDNPKRNPLIEKIKSEIKDTLKFTEYLPFYSAAAACGYFGQGEEVAMEGWIKAEGLGRLNRNMFVIQAHGKSMEPRIPESSLCVFRTPVVGSRNGKIVLVQHRDVIDPDYGGSYSIKEYQARKVYMEDGQWSHEEILLKPLNPLFNTIEILESESDNYTVIAEFIGIITHPRPLAGNQRRA